MPHEIERFASRPDVDRFAVESFLAGMETDDEAVINLIEDRVVYGWGPRTTLAICEGIQQAKEEV
jgi:hypothetical protein